MDRCVIAGYLKFILSWNRSFLFVRLENFVSTRLNAFASRILKCVNKNLCIIKSGGVIITFMSPHLSVKNGTTRNVHALVIYEVSGAGSTELYANITECRIFLNEEFPSVFSLTKRTLVTELSEIIQFPSNLYSIRNNNYRLRIISDG